MQIFDKLKPLGLLVLRLGVAAVFLATGYDKLFGALAKWLAWFPQQGFPYYFAYVAGSLEFFGGILLVLGLLTRVVGLHSNGGRGMESELAAFGNLQCRRLWSAFAARRGMFFAFHPGRGNTLCGWSDL